MISHCDESLLENNGYICILVYFTSVQHCELRTEILKLSAQACTASEVLHQVKAVLGTRLPQKTH